MKLRKRVESDQAVDIFEHDTESGLTYIVSSAKKKMADHTMPYDARIRNASSWKMKNR